MRRLLPLALLLAPLAAGGCASPAALHRAVLAYDRAVSRIETELLLLNIARARHAHPIHFTVVSSVAATFDFSVSARLIGGADQALGTGLGTLGLGASENPTVTIVPVQGEEFTRRVLAPIDGEKLALVASQDVDHGLVVRLMARGLALEGPEPPVFLANAPERPEAYAGFRRRVAHLSSLALARALHVGVVAESKRGAVVALTNYDPAALPPAERAALVARARRATPYEVLVDVRADQPGGGLPIRGVLPLRSLKGILGFVARGIAEAPEVDVPKDPRTGPIASNPRRVLALRETERRPRDAVFAVPERGSWYSLDPEPDGDPALAAPNHEAFDVLFQLFQLTVTNAHGVAAPPVTIAK